MSSVKKEYETPLRGVEPRSRRWERRVLAVTPQGIVYSETIAGIIYDSTSNLRLIYLDNAEIDIGRLQIQYQETDL